MSRLKRLAEELEASVPKDFDPEDIGHFGRDSESGSEGENTDNDGARAHYEIVGKGNLRKSEDISLGPQYAGSRVHRNALLEDDSDDPFSREFVDQDGSSEDNSDGEAIGGDVRRENTWNGFSSLGQEKEDTDEDEFLDEDEDIDELEEDGSEGDNHESTDGSQGEPHGIGIGESNAAKDSDIQLELRRLVAADQQRMGSTLSERMKEDAEKGKAVKKQRLTFDSLLNIRIKLQKALIAANSFSVVEQEGDSHDDHNDIIAAAEEAAINLWNNLSALRASLYQKRTGNKRKFAQMSSDAPLRKVWEETKSYESDLSAHRNATLNFWSEKCRPATVQSQTRGLNAAPQQSLSDVIAGQLSDMEQLVARTQIARSCAPLQAANSDSKGQEDALPIYDDADFYGTLLQTLISQRNASAESSLAGLNTDANIAAQPWQLAREAKTKKVVDTRASKGRKLRYTVHEKLQNFMAPEDRSTWSDRQSDELFGSLFGRSIGLAETDYERDDGHEMRNADLGGLRLFAGAASAS